MCVVNDETVYTLRIFLPFAPGEHSVRKQGLLCRGAVITWSSSRAGEVLSLLPTKPGLMQSTKALKWNAASIGTFHVLVFTVSVQKVAPFLLSPLGKTRSRETRAIPLSHSLELACCQSATYIKWLRLY